MTALLPFRAHWPRKLAAAPLVLALGLAASHVALAESPPENGTLALRYLSYKDSQPGIDRISVRAPSVLVSAPINGEWSFDAALTTDTVSGASPSYYSEKSSMANMHDVRHGKDAHLTRYFSRGSLTAGASFSTESDYFSRAFSLTGALSTEDKNTTLNLGAGITRDRINPSNLVVANETKSVNDFLLGVTQVMGPRDIVQLNLTHARGKGYFSDPYKFFDKRPREKRQTALLARWNHHIGATDATARLSWRYYTDSFGIRSHTVGAEYVQPLSGGWTVTPLVRLYTQTAANFYLEAQNLPDPTFPDGFLPGVTIMSEDQRLSAYGARTAGLKLAYQLNRAWQFDAKFEAYEQRSSWSLQGSGSRGIEPFRARILQVGVAYAF